MIRGRRICSGTNGRARSAIFSFGKPASISFSPVTASAAANAIWGAREKNKMGPETTGGKLLISLLERCKQEVKSNYRECD